MKNTNTKLILAIILLIIIIIPISINYQKSSLKPTINPNNNIINITKNHKLTIKKNDTITLNIQSPKDNNISINKSYQWQSSNPKIAKVNANGELETKNTGTTTIIAKHNNKTIKTNIKVYDIKKIIIIVGDSRMDNFKDDNNFTKTSDYEVKYKDLSGIISNINKVYVVSLSGMKYKWLEGSDEYKDRNATKFVQEIINKYEEQTTDTNKYEIKILFNLGVNDLKSYNLKGTTPTKVANKYLTKLNELMSNQWHSNILNVSLSMVTIFPVNEKQVECYFPSYSNKDIEQFNNTIKKNYKGNICDAYNDIKFTKKSYREKYNNADCATRDGLHLSPDFNTKILYQYLLNNCATFNHI